MNSTLDFLVEIIPCRPQGVVSPTLGAPPSAVPLDITGRVIRQGFGSINRAMERDLLSFKTGDLTLTARNTDGYFDDLFAFFGSTDIWSLRIQRRGVVQFWGCLIGKGSITFDRKAKTCQVTAYGLTKLLDMTSAEPVSRTITLSLGAQLTAGNTTVTLADTTGLLSGDILHVTDHVNKEDLTIRQVTSSTVVSLEAAAAATYVTTSAIILTTPYYRYLSISTLVNSLFTEAGIGIADLRLSNSQFKRLAPTPVNVSGLPALTLDIRRGLTQKGGLRVQSIAGDATYSQATPDAAWVKEGGASNQAGWADWTKYYVEGSGEPPVHLRDPIADGGESGGGECSGPQGAGHDFISSPTKTAYVLLQNGPGFNHLRKYTTTDGTTWSADTLVSALPAGANSKDIHPGGCEYDPVRDIVICTFTDFIGSASYLYYWDVAGAAWVNMKPASDSATTGYFGPVYCADLDMIIALKGTWVDQSGGPRPLNPNFTICAFRGAVKLWDRPFPSCSVNTSNANNIRTFYPTRTIRSVNGALCAVAISDGSLQFISSADQFQSYSMKQVFNNPTTQYMLASRINGAYCFTGYQDTLPRGHAIAAPFYAGVINYADFAGLSCADALKKLSLLVNALFWIDDDLQGHFVARDLYDSGAVLDIADRVKERQDDLIWDETAEYVTVSGNGVSATAGDAGFATEGITLASDYLPNTAFAQALADSYDSFYSAQRQQYQMTIRDKDGTIFRPLDRVLPDSGIRFLVYESDHSLMDDEITVTLLEDK